MNIREKTTVGVQNDILEFGNTLTPVIPDTARDESYVPSTNFSMPTNSSDDFLAELNDVFQLRAEDPWNVLFQPDEPFRFDDVLLENLRAVEGEFTQVLEGIPTQSVAEDTTPPTIGLIPNSSEKVNISISPGLAYEARTFIGGEGPSQGPTHELGSNMGAVNPILNSENYSNPSLSLSENNPNSWPSGPNFLSHPSGMNSTTVGSETIDTPQPGVPFGTIDDLQLGASLGTVDTPQLGASFNNFMYPNTTGNSLSQFSNTPGNSLSQFSNIPGNSLSQFPNATGNPLSQFPDTTGNSLSQFQSWSSPSFRMLPHGSGSSGQQFSRYHQNEVTRLSPLVEPANPSISPLPMLPQQQNQTNFCPRPPSLADIGNFVQAWVGFLAGKFHKNRAFLYQAKILRSPTSSIPFTLWSSRIDIALFLPRSAVSYTMGICGGPIDHVFFEIAHSNNNIDDLYHHLKNNQLCAKIVLPSHTMILYTTGNKYQYLGALFAGNLVFFEPTYSVLEGHNSFM